MIRTSRGRTLLVALAVALGVANVGAQPAPPPPAEPLPPSGAPTLEPKAVDLLKASSARLAAARSMSFTAVAYYESPSRPGPPLVYATRSDVTLQRPNKLRVITTGDGPASEFYYDGQTMVAFMPAENLAAVAPAPPTIDAALEWAYQAAAIYFPFTDVMVADPYADIAKVWDASHPRSRARRTICAAIRGFSRPMARTASPTAWYPLLERVTPSRHSAREVGSPRQPGRATRPHARAES